MAVDLRPLIVFLLWPLAAQSQQDVREIPTRPGVTLRFIYAPADNPVASAVLLQGGSGAIGIFPNGSTRSEGFLATGARRFAGNGISVVVPDAPSDRGHLHDFRTAPEHVRDIAALVAFLRRQADVPVWLIGTSNGALSAAFAATVLDDPPAGIVLTAAVTKRLSSQAHPVTDAPLDAVKVPALLVHHREDGCVVTPYAAMPAVLAALKASPRTELIAVDGGGPGSGTPCGGGHHQFLGIEAAVTQTIAEWIRRNPPGKRP